jgi:hypothetical protein
MSTCTKNQALAALLLLDAALLKRMHGVEALLTEVECKSCVAVNHASLSTSSGATSKPESRAGFITMKAWCTTRDWIKHQAPIGEPPGGCPRRWW